MYRRSIASAGILTSVFAVLLILVFASTGVTVAQESQQAAEEAPPPPPERRGVLPAPDRGEDEGAGPFDRLIIRGVTVIDGTGGPPRGPVDIIVEGNRIASIRGIGTPGVPINEDRRPGEADYEVDANGMYLMPGIVDLHVHTGGVPKAPEAEYVYKLWLANGITTVRGVSTGPLEWSLNERERSARNEIVAPRIVSYHRPGSNAGDWEGTTSTPDGARDWVRYAAEKGVEGLKLGSYRPEIMEALLDEANKLGLGSTAHLGQSGVAQMNALDAARLGLTGMTHFYGLFESMYDGYDVQPWPVDMNYNDEQFRFGQVARQWDLIHPPGSEGWNALLEEFLELDYYLNPTMTIYSAGRDVMRARTADWHELYTLPSLQDFFDPSRLDHGSYFYDWTTHDEVAWKKFYQVWMKFLNQYKNMGGKVTVGSDSGFIYQLYGFGTILEMEMLQEAGFHPLEVIRAATMHGAMEIAKPKGEAIEYGVIRTGMLADMIIVDSNPLHNLKVLYGTGAMKLNDQTGLVERVGGVKYTIKDGIVYDAKQLLADVAEMVEQKRRERAASN